MTRPSLCLCTVILGACTPGAVPAPPTAVPAPAIVSRPAAPLQGSLVVLEIHPPAGDSAVTVRGELAGEPLHFHRAGSTLRALGGVPFTAHDSVAIRLVFERATGASATLALAIPVTPRAVEREKLRTRPEFVDPPDSLLGRIDAEQRLTQEIRRRSHDTPRMWQGRFERPRPGAVTSAFGTERLFNGTVQSRHLGVDFAGRRGAPVRAANRGVVAFAGPLYYSGTTVLLDHGEGLVTGYLHLSHVLVAVGDTVRRGQVIGRVGSSGRVTGPHLHWLAAYGDISVDPLDLLTLDVAQPLQSPP